MGARGEGGLRRGVVQLPLRYLLGMEQGEGGCYRIGGRVICSAHGLFCSRNRWAHKLLSFGSLHYLPTYLLYLTRASTHRPTHS